MQGMCVSEQISYGHRNIPVREPDPEPIPVPNPEPDSTISNGESDITSVDREALIRAVTDQLHACSGLAPQNDR